jgi:hypothetical protein
MPDRVQNVFRNEATGYQLSSISAPDNHRYFQKLRRMNLLQMHRLITNLKG